jgi:hypothetical protein
MLQGMNGRTTLFHGFISRIFRDKNHLRHVLAVGISCQTLVNGRILFVIRCLRVNIVPKSDSAVRTAGNKFS